MEISASEHRRHFIVFVVAALLLEGLALPAAPGPAFFLKEPLPLEHSTAPSADKLFPSFRHLALATLRLPGVESTAGEHEAQRLASPPPSARRQLQEVAPVLLFFLVLFTVLTIWMHRLPGSPRASHRN